QDLSQAVANGAFREDLYYRLKVVPIRVPPLRERGQDTLHLARHFLHTYSRAFAKSFQSFTDAADRALLAYPWPGNIRELKNLFERLVLLESGPVVEAGMLGLPDVAAFRVSERTLPEGDALGRLAQV